MDPQPATEWPGSISIVSIIKELIQYLKKNQHKWELRKSESYEVSIFSITYHGKSCKEKNRQGNPCRQKTCHNLELTLVGIFGPDIIQVVVLNREFNKAVVGVRGWDLLQDEGRLTMYYCGLSCPHALRKYVEEIVRIGRKD